MYYRKPILCMTLQPLHLNLLIQYILKIFFSLNQCSPDRWTRHSRRPALYRWLRLCFVLWPPPPPPPLPPLLSLMALLVDFFLLREAAAFCRQDIFSVQVQRHLWINMSTRLDLNHKVNPGPQALLQFTKKLVDCSLAR